MEKLAQARQVLQLEAEALLEQANFLDDNFLAAVELLLQNKGRLITMGIGKSGHIAAKAAATFASTGTAAFFVHPAEAGHGDLGMITEQDVVLILSNSGESSEITVILPALEALQVPLIVISSAPNSTLGKAAKVHIQLKIKREACPLNLAPTSSTTVSLALCDALAICLMQARAFESKDFARSHPLGRLGRRLCIKVKDVMRTNLPQNNSQDSIQEALFQLTNQGLGATLIVENQKLIGIFTDGDLRRALQKNQALNTKLATVMTTNPYAINSEILAAEALQFMERKKISVLPVLENEQLVGILQIHDLLAAGVA